MRSGTIALAMDQVSEIREKIDLVSFISEFVPLKKAGRNFKANCPFHAEKTPSFVVSPERQIWHCFGCGLGGDCYSFLMQYEHIEFPEALRLLAKRTGVVLASARFDSPVTSKKEGIYKLNALALGFYHFLLLKHNAGKRALDYLAKRGITLPLMETFKIGFAPNMGTALVSYLMNKKNYKAEELLEAGLATMRGRSVIDFFSGRIMFPLIDHRENVVGFAGRAIDERTFGPKYINTRETLVYHKGEMFFGLGTAKEAMKKQNQAIVVEGEFDVISCFREGITNVVAIKGTALTLQQATLLSRFVQKVTICFDTDAAGQEAMRRSLAVLEPKGLTTTVIVPPLGKDPDEALQKNPGEFQNAVKHDVPVYDYLLDQEVERHDVSSVEGKRLIADSLLPLFSCIDNEIVKEHYLKHLSKVLDTTYEGLLREVERLTKREHQDRQQFVLPKVKHSREDLLEEYLLALIVQSENAIVMFSKAAQFLDETVLPDRAPQKILRALSAYFQKNEVFSGKIFGDSLPTELQEAYNRSLLFPITPLPNEERYLLEIGKVASQLRSIYLRRKIKEIASEIGELEQKGMATDSLSQTYSRLASMLKK